MPRRRRWRDGCIWRETNVGGATRRQTLPADEQQDPRSAASGCSLLQAHRWVGDRVGCNYPGKRARVVTSSLAHVAYIPVPRVYLVPPKQERTTTEHLVEMPETRFLRHIYIQTLHIGPLPRFFGEKPRLQPYRRFLGVEEGGDGREGSRMARPFVYVQREHS
jgi:hypothetical protein